MTMTTKRLNLFLLGCIAVCLATLACVAARGAELPAPKFTPVPKFLPIPSFADKPGDVDDLGIRDALRIMRACRAATADIPTPQSRAEVSAYVDRCTPLVTAIIKRELEATFPPSAATTTINVPVTASVVVPETELFIIGAEWCGPCKLLWRAIERIAPIRNRLGWEATEIDADNPANQAWLEHYEATGSVPQLLLFRRGKLIDRRVGGMEEAELRVWVTKQRKP
jgi:thiol-disulfide isomerase/thioredoxin